MKVVALPSIRTAPTRIEQTTIANTSRVRSSQARVLLDIAPSLRFYFATAESDLEIRDTH